MNVKIGKQTKKIYCTNSTYFLFKSFKSAVEAGLARATSSDEILVEMIRVIQENKLLPEIVKHLRGE